MEFWQSVLIAVGTSLVLWLPQNVQHEGAHALLAKIYGSVITEFHPYPGKLNGNSVFAYVRFSNPRKFTNPERAWISGAPWAANTIMLIFLAIANSQIHNPIVSAILAGWMINNLADGINNCRLVLFADNEKLSRSHADLPRVARYDGYPPRLAKWMVGGWSVATIFLVFWALWP